MDTVDSRHTRRMSPMQEDSDLAEDLCAELEDDIDDLPPAPGVAKKVRTDATSKMSK